jgi:hypothetical protein
MMKDEFGDVRLCGEYRTSRLVLEAWDKLEKK